MLRLVCSPPNPHPKRPVPQQLLTFAPVDPGRPCPRTRWKRSPSNSGLLRTHRPRQGLRLFRPTQSPKTMKLVVETPSPMAATELVVCERVCGPDFGCVWHHHAECEITLVVRGGTERRVGNDISPIFPGDLVFLGSNVPHDYRNQTTPGQNAAEEVEAIVVQFLPRLPGQDDWLNRSSMKPVQRLFERAGQGLVVKGITRLTAARIMHDLLQTQGMKRVILLLQLLDLLANSEDVQEICPGFIPPAPAGTSDRVAKACEHIAEHLAEPIYVEELAAMCGMGRSAFSRLFKRNTGRTLPQYVNELRIDRACGLLASSDLTVSQIAMECGFISPSHFQRKFREHQRCAPLTYRHRLSQPR